MDVKRKQTVHGASYSPRYYNSNDKSRLEGEKMKTAKKPPKGLKCYSDIVRREPTGAFTIDVIVDEPTSAFEVKELFREDYIMRIVCESGGLFSIGKDWDVYNQNGSKIYHAYYRHAYEDSSYIIVNDAKSKLEVAELDLCTNIETHFNDNVRISNHKKTKRLSGKLKKKGSVCTFIPGNWKAENDKLQGRITVFKDGNSEATVRTSRSGRKKEICIEYLHCDSELIILLMVLRFLV